LDLEGAHIEPDNTAFTPLDFYKYPYTHSLVAVLVWSLVFGGVYYALRRNSRAAVVVAAAVLSHWVLDFITHRPDLPLAPGGELRVGLGLWNSVAATVLVEGALFAAAVALYARLTRPLDRSGMYGLWLLVVLLCVIYAANILGPPPPDERSLAYAGLLQWIFVPWMSWIDRHRTVRVPS
jgi:membrane-bound metal-dependent hydrolase YbcI (DUF457 family)